MAQEAFVNSGAVSAPTGSVASASASTSASGSIADRLEQAIQAGRIELPVLPSVAVEVQSLIDKDAHTAALVQAIGHEPTVAAALIRYANVATYIGLSELQDLEQAIMRLGRTSVRTVVVSLSAKAAFSGRPEHRWLYRILWAHAIMTATAARRLALLASVPRETAFLAGLLHDIGKVVVLRGVETLHKEDPGGFHVDDESLPELMDTLHCSVTDVFCRTWNISGELGAAITRHHQTPLTAPDDGLVAVVQLADLIAAKLGASVHPDPGMTLEDKPSAAFLHVNEVTLANVMSDVENEFKRISVVL
jgi:HD-like signal output (HDOD) protein